MGCLTRELFLDEETHDIDLSTWPGPGTPDEVKAALRTHGWRVTRTGGDPTTRDDAALRGEGATGRRQRRRWSVAGGENVRSAVEPFSMKAYRAI